MKFSIPKVLSGRQQRKSIWREAVALCLLVAMHLIAWPQEKPSEANLPPLSQTALPSADVAVLFDASLSMRNQPYREIRQAVIEFASALTNKEVLHLRVFGDVAGAPLEGPADQLAGNVADHLPIAPLFHNTDLGAAISKSLEFFERPHANDIQVLFLLTDGLHEPPPGSPFGRDFAGDPHWRDLEQRAAALSQRRKVLVYGFGLGPRTDVSLLLRLFPASNVEVVTGNAAQVAATLQRVRENLRLTQLRQAPAMPHGNAPPLGDRYGLPDWLLTISLLSLSGLVWLMRQRRKQIAMQRATNEQRQAERMRLAGRLRIWPIDQIEPSDEEADLSLQKSRQLDLLMNADGGLLIAMPGTAAEQAIAHLSGHLTGAAPGKAESGRVEFRLEAARGHRLAYESGGELRETARAILCDRDLIEIDGRWRLRYANHRLRTRAEVESARNE